VHTILLGAARGDQDDRQHRPRAPNLGQDLEAVVAGQHDVEHGEVEFGRQRRRHAIGAVGARDHPVAGELQRVDEPATDRGIVLDDEHGLRHGRRFSLARSAPTNFS
jgi:hypothetical protein